MHKLIYLRTGISRGPEDQPWARRFCRDSWGLQGEIPILLQAEQLHFYLLYLQGFRSISSDKKFPLLKQANKYKKNVWPIGPLRGFLLGRSRKKPLKQTLWGIWGSRGLMADILQRGSLIQCHWQQGGLVIRRSS